MFFNLLYPLSDSIGLFNVFQYLTFRTGAAVLTALLISFALGAGTDPGAARTSGARAADPQRWDRRPTRPRRERRRWAGS